VTEQADPGSGTLIIGYGNRLRTDDGLGWRAIELLTDDRRVAGARLLARHQLTPELAADFAEAALVVLIDADAGAPPGQVTVRQVVASTAGGPLLSHHVDPPSLVALSHELYGRLPAVYVVGVGALSLGEGDRLSLEVEAAMPRLLETVSEIVAGRTA
jgi:hydrogenase maturation protease